jgi:hypothetical protein
MTAAPIVPAKDHGAGIKPEWIRLPKPGTLCPLSSLTRSTLNGLILPTAENSYRPPVQSICLRKRGKLKGCRLISYDSLMNYLKSFLTKDGSSTNDNVGGTGGVELFERQHD